MRQQIAFDTSSSRTKDENGFLHVAKSNITRAEVADYYGREIPNHELLGLSPDQIYSVYRPADELEKARETFNGIPLLIRHEPDSAFDPQKALRIGATGTNAEFDGEYLTNALSFHDAKAISLIESGNQKELSAGYLYDPVLEDGEFKGKKYQVKMTKIRGNHVAIVEVGRAGPTCVVADALKGDKMKKSDGLLAKLQNKKVAMDTKSEKETLTEDSAEEQIISIVSELANKHDEEGTVIEKTKELLKSMHTGAEDEKEPEEGEETKDNCSAEDEEVKKKEEKSMTGDQTTVFKPVTLDVDKIKSDITKELTQKFQAKEKAASKVRFLVGNINTMTFDSAAEIYGYALKQSGKNIEKYEASAYEAMVDMLAESQAANISVANSFAFDSAKDGKLLGHDITRFKRG